MGPVLVVLLLIPAVFGQLISCKWTDPVSGTTYDLQPLFRNSAEGDYYGTDFTYRYIMNICGTSTAGGDCTDKNGMLCQFDNDNQYVSLIAEYNPSDIVYSLISPADPDDGVVLTINNGDPCPLVAGSPPRKAVISLYCDPNAPTTNRISVSEEAGDPCTYHVALIHPNACPVDGDLPPQLSSGVTVDASTENNAWSYWTIDVGQGMQELQINTQQTTASGSGYLELYVRYGAKPTPQTYDKSDTSIRAGHKVVVRTSDPTDPLRPGTYYIAVRALGDNVDYRLQPWVFQCFNDCSGHGTCKSMMGSPDYVCVCDAGWESDLPDCSAEVIDPTMADYKYSHTLVGSTWRYYRFHLDDEHAYELYIDMSRSIADENQALPTLMIKEGGWPTYQDNDGIIQDLWTPSANWALELRAPVLTPGTWIIAVVGSPDTVFDYYLELTVNDCPQDCSGHGQCNPYDHICTCDEDYGHLDCSLREIPLVPWVPIAITIGPYATSYYAIDVPYNLAMAHIDMLIHVVEDHDEGFYPRLILAPASMGVPTLSNYLLASALPLKANTNLRIPADLLQNNAITNTTTTWYIGIVSYSPDAMQLHIQLSYEGYCVNDCSSHGDCAVDNSTYAVYCICENGWFGAGCDVNSAMMESKSSDNVDTGLAVGLVFIFLFLGVVVGILIKRAYPNLFGRSEQQFVAAGAGSGKATYSAMQESSDV